MTLTVESPSAILSDLRGKWVPVPLKVPAELRSAAYEWCVNQAGEGRNVSTETGIQTLDLVVHDGDGGFRGDWAFRYSITSEGEIEVLSVHLLAKLR